MHGDPAAAAYPDGAYLPLLPGMPDRTTRLFHRRCVRPSTRIRRWFRSPLWRVAQVFADIVPKYSRSRDRVNHDLLQSMKGDIASPVGVKKRDIVAVFGIAHEHMFFFPSFTKCIKPGMFQRRK